MKGVIKGSKGSRIASQMPHRESGQRRQKLDKQDTEWLRRARHDQNMKEDIKETMGTFLNRAINAPIVPRNDQYAS